MSFARDWSLYSRASIDSIFGGVSIETLSRLHDQLYERYGDILNPKAEPKGEESEEAKE